MSKDYTAKKLFIDAMPDISGNTVNGVGETEQRQASPFFWHAPNKQTHGVLQQTVLGEFAKVQAVAEQYTPHPPEGRGPKPIAVNSDKCMDTAETFTQKLREFALNDEADLVGITALDPLYLYEGYSVEGQWIIMLGVTMDYAALSINPPSAQQPQSAVEVGRQYNRAARASRKLANYIREQGYVAQAHEGPNAKALNMIPAAIAAGLGELGKHGSMINGEYGSMFRLSAVTTDMPLLADSAMDIAAQDFCLNCQVCTNACPPNAISNDKVMVRGVKKWSVDFDRCIPYFGETLGCAICLSVCPWSFPERAPLLTTKMMRRRKRKSDNS